MRWALESGVGAVAGGRPPVRISMATGEFPRRSSRPRGGDRQPGGGRRLWSRPNRPQTLPDRPAGGPRPPSEATPYAGLRERLPFIGYRSPQRGRRKTEPVHRFGVSPAKAVSPSSPPLSSWLSPPGSLRTAGAAAASVALSIGGRTRACGNQLPTRPWHQRPSQAQPHSRLRGLRGRHDPPRLAREGEPSDPDAGDRLRGDRFRRRESAARLPPSRDL